MKLQDFGFRTWNNNLNNYVLYPTEHYFFVPKDDKDLEIELFTGFYDKNNTKIYEGDIVVCCVDRTTYFVVCFDKQKGFILKASEYFTLPLTLFINNIEVIGNIHEKPELLGK